MASKTDGNILENDPRNRCIGCGPANPRGLALEFRSVDKGAAAAELKARDTLEGWPGRLHSGVLYTALLETANWTVYAARGRIGLPVRTGPLRTTRWVATGERLALRGEVTASTPTGLVVTAHARAADDEVVASLEREFELPSRARLLEAMGYDEVPPELEGALPPG